MTYSIANHVRTTLAADVAIGATSISVNAATTPYNTPPDPGGDTALLVLTDSLSAPTKFEIVSYTGRTGTGPYTLTGVTKALEGTSDQAWTTGDICFADATAAILASYVTGPASAVDSNLAAFDTTTGKLIKDSGQSVTALLNRANHTGTQPLSTISDAGGAAALNVGTGPGTVAAGDHRHDGVYEPADATILKDADIGVTVQGYDADTAKLDVAQTFTAQQTFTETADTVYALSGTTPSIDPANGHIQTWTLTANSAPTDALTTGQIVLLLIDDGTAYTISWPTITWLTDGGSAPTLATSGYTQVLLWKVGTTLYGARVGG